MEFAVWTIGVIGIAVVAYLFLLFAYSSMNEPKSYIYYSQIERPKTLKRRKFVKKERATLSSLVKK